VGLISRYHTNVVPDRIVMAGSTRRLDPSENGAKVEKALGADQARRQGQGHFGRLRVIDGEPLKPIRRYLSALVEPLTRHGKRELKPRRGKGVRAQHRRRHYSAAASDGALWRRPAFDPGGKRTAPTSTSTVD